MILRGVPTAVKHRDGANPEMQIVVADCLANWLKIVHSNHAPAAVPNPCTFVYKRYRLAAKARFPKS